jgi:UDP-GlcNAc:undecaprenyl-phosphate GlcNAc-1-phosphate transferase
MNEINFYFFSVLFSIICYFIILNNKKKIANFLKIYDIPDKKRKIHKKITPRTASYSLALTLLFGLTNNFYFNFFSNDFNNIITASLTIFLIGFYDDKFNLSPIKKIFLVSLVIFTAIYFSDNLIINKLYISTFDKFFSLGNLSIFFTILCCLLLINSLNLSDGINGLAIGISFFWILYFLQIYKVDFNIFLIIVLFNIFLSFWHNLGGKQFLGDSGSLMIATLISLTVIYGHNLYSLNNSISNNSEQIIILFLLPGLDMVRLFFYRIINKKNPFLADQNHFHHYLIKNFSLNKSLLFYFLLMNIPIIGSLYLKLSYLFVICFTTVAYFFIVYSLKKNSKI